jgi:TATA-binding protein-associated factor Taf7
MIQELANLIDDFPGPANQTRCFLHILNLVVKSILQQFDLPKAKKKSDGDDGDEGDETAQDQETEELLRLAGEIDLEEEITAGAGSETDATGDDNVKGWVDEHEEMTREELNELEESLKPVRLLLTKVSRKLLNILFSNSCLSYE